MVSTRLEILGTNQAIAKDIPVSINYVLADIREPDKRNSSYTKTVQIYGTNESNKLFENIFEYNVATGYFNVNRKIQAIYYVNDIENFRGDLQLISVSVNPDKSIIYNCSISGNEGALFFDLANDFLTDLDFSEYNHDYTRDKIIDSWSNICDVSGTPTTLANGQGYLYGFVQRGFTSSENVFGVTDFLPQLYLREYLYKIFEAKGYTWNSAFLDTDEFKSIVVEPNLSIISLNQSQLNNQQWYVGLNSDQTLSDLITTTVLYNDESTLNGFFDLGNQYSLGEVVLNKTGYYNIACTIYMDVVINHTNPSFSYAHAPTAAIKTEIQKSTDNGTTWFTLNSNYKYFKSNPYWNKNQNYSSTDSVATGEQLFNSGDRFRIRVRFDHPLAADNWIQYFNSSNINIGSGGGDHFGANGIGVIKLKGNIASGNTFYGLSTRKQALEGNQILINNAIPQNIKQKDFLKSVMQMFNLFIEPDKNNPKLLNIEPYSDFYGVSSENWNNKIDYSKEVLINPVSLVDGKTYFFQYKDDKDYYNTKYKDSWAESFGTERIDVDNDFIKTEKKNELIFSPTPNVANYFMGASVPKIFKDDPSIAIKPQTPNLRVLYYGGVKQSLNFWTFKKINDTDIVSQDYPYVGHVDDPQAPTYDLNFGTPKEVYYNFIGSSFTTNNLYNRFHKPYIENIIDRDSRVVVAYLWLTAKDIYNFSFRKKYFIDGAYYLVNKIIDYNPLEQRSTKCELIKILNVNSFTPENILFTDSPTISSGNGVNLNPNDSALRLGSGNNNGTNSILVGNNSFIPSDAINCFVIGDNIVLPNGSNAITYMNGNVIPTITGQSTTIKTITSDYNITVLDGTILCDASGGNITVDLAFATPSAALNETTINIGGTDYTVTISKVITIKKIDSSANTVTLDNGTDLIDSASTKVLTTQWESVTIQWDGTDWYIL